MFVTDVELKLVRGGGGGDSGTGSRSWDYGHYGGASELRSVEVEALDRSNSKRLGDLGLR